MGFAGGERGNELVEILQALGADADFVRLGIATRQCVTVIDRGTGMTTELVEESAPVPDDCYGKLRGMVVRRLPHCRALVLSGTITPGGPVQFYRECVELANKAGCLAIVDAKGAPLKEALKASPGLVKPNRAELAATVGTELPDEIAVMDAMRRLHKRGARRVVVTDGNGPVLAFDGQQFWRIRPPKIEAVNPIGSGDAFTAGLVWRLVDGDDLGEACRWGAAAGSANALSLMPGELNSSETTSLAAETTAEPIQVEPRLLPGVP